MLTIVTTNNDVVEFIAKNLVNLSKEGNYEMLTLAPNDHRRFDLSFNSIKMDEWWVPFDQKMSRRMFHFYNSVAQKYKKFGGILPIRIGVYDMYTAPPNGDLPKLESGLIPYIAHFGYCQLHNIENKDCAPNRRFCEIVNTWSCLSKNIFIYEYAYKHNWLELPWPVYIHAVQDIQFYLNRGAIGYFTQFSDQNTFPFLLNYYIISKALWNSEIDSETIQSEFYLLFFREVSDKMKSCYQLIEYEFSHNHAHVTGDAQKNLGKVYKKENIQKALSIAMDAYEQATDPIVKSRVDMMIVWLKYSLNILSIIEGKNIEQSCREIINLVKEAKDKKYPVFNTETLFKQRFFKNFPHLN